jgi:hypothetical protein
MMQLDTLLIISLLDILVSLFIIHKEMDRLSVTHPQAPQWTHRKSKGEDIRRTKS